MDKNYLLTYQKGNCQSYAWFDTEEELDDFVDKYDVYVIEIFKINDIELISE